MEYDMDDVKIRAMVEHDHNPREFKVRNTYGVVAHTIECGYCNETWPCDARKQLLAYLKAKVLSRVDLYDWGHRDGEEATLDTLSQHLTSMTEGAEQAPITQDMTYASGVRDAATLVQRTLEQRRKEWADAERK